MTKRLFLNITMGYAAATSVLPVNILQAVSLIQQARAEEGLYRSIPPVAATHAAWNSTYIIYFSVGVEATWGSAFVIRNVRQGNQRVLDLMTADHVLKNNCGRRNCRSHMIFPNGHIAPNRQTGLPEFQSQPLKLQNFTVLARDPGRDLAVIRITISADDANPIAVTFGRQTSRVDDRVWAFGYPEVELRKSGHGIITPAHMTRRWSTGTVMGPMKISMFNTAKLDVAGTLHLATTNDSLTGNSGGPLADDSGQVIGVVVQEASGLTRGSEYARRTNPSAIATVVVGPAGLRDFLNEAYGQQVSMIAL